MHHDFWAADEDMRAERLEVWEGGFRGSPIEQESDRTDGARPSGGCAIDGGFDTDIRIAPCFEFRGVEDRVWGARSEEEIDFAEVVGAIEDGIDYRSKGCHAESS